MAIFPVLEGLLSYRFLSLAINSGEDCGFSKFIFIEFPKCLRLKLRDDVKKKRTIRIRPLFKICKNENACGCWILFNKIYLQKSIIVIKTSIKSVNLLNQDNNHILFL